MNFFTFLLISCFGLVICQYGSQNDGIELNEPLIIDEVSEDNITNQGFVELKSPKRRNLNDNTCVDYTPEKHYINSQPVEGLPPSGISTFNKEYNFVFRPKEISVCDLEELHRYCVEAINEYRSGVRKFKDGTDDENVLAGLVPLIEATGINQCSNEASLGALAVNYQSDKQINGCEAGHHSSFVCPWKGKAAQNSCCARGHNAWGQFDWRAHLNVTEIKAELDRCLRTMWDEGITDGQKSHWKIMRNTAFKYVSCSFAWSEQGRIMMRQDFTKGYPSEASVCSCDGKQVGDDDGCGKPCVRSDNYQGQWYCRKPGKKNGKFRTGRCSWNCGDSTFRHHRCCLNTAGKACNKKEKINVKYCLSPRPKCPLN